LSLCDLVSSSHSSDSFVLTLQLAYDPLREGMTMKWAWDMPAWPHVLQLSFPSEQHEASHTRDFCVDATFDISDAGNPFSYKVRASFLVYFNVLLSLYLSLEIRVYVLVVVVVVVVVLSWLIHLIS
jgi:hypothetical protein